MDLDLHQYPYRWIGYFSTAGESLRGSVDSDIVEFLKGATLLYMLIDFFIHLTAGNVGDAFRGLLFNIIASVLIPDYVVHLSTKLISGLSHEMALPFIVIRFAPLLVALVAIAIMSQPLDNIVKSTIDKFIRF